MVGEQSEKDWRELEERLLQLDPKEFLKHLDEQSRNCLAIGEECYAGDWSRFREDLLDNQMGQSHVFTYSREDVEAYLPRVRLLVKYHQLHQAEITTAVATHERDITPDLPFSRMSGI